MTSQEEERKSLARTFAFTLSAVDELSDWILNRPEGEEDKAVGAILGTLFACARDIARLHIACYGRPAPGEMAAMFGLSDDEGGESCATE